MFPSRLKEWTATRPGADEAGAAGGTAESVPASGAFLSAAAMIRALPREPLMAQAARVGGRLALDGGADAEEAGVGERAGQRGVRPDDEQVFPRRAGAGGEHRRMQGLRAFLREEEPVAQFRGDLFPERRGRESVNLRDPDRAARLQQLGQAGDDVGRGRRDVRAGPIDQSIVIEDQRGWGSSANCARRASASVTGAVSASFRSLSRSCA